MIAALEIDLNHDLGPFSRYLNQQHIPHRVTEEGVNQVLWVDSEENRQRVHDLFQAYVSGSLKLTRGTRGVPFSPMALARRFPLTMAIVLTNILFFPVTMGLDEADPTVLFQLMTLVAFELRGQDVYFSSLGATLTNGEYWRLLSPMCLHFGWLHVVFNLLWVWEVGRRIEVICGASVLLLVTLVASLIANLTQYVASGPSLFGGMSGVVFGYLGFSLVWSRMVPSRSTGLAPGIYVFMAVYLIVGLTGTIDLLGLGALANGAHVGGAVTGLAIGAVAGILARLPEPGSD